MIKVVVFLLMSIPGFGQVLTKANPKGTPAPHPATETTAKPAAPGPAATPSGPYIPPPVYSDKNDLYDVPKITPVANKIFWLRNEITLQPTFLATDPYFKYLAIGGSYTHTFSSFWGWEVLNGAFAFSFASGLTNDLEGPTFGVNQTLIDSLQYYGTTNITMSPFYVKNLVFNSSTVYSEISFVLGAGVADFVYAGIQPTIDAGIIIRYFLGPKTSLKFDVRDYVFPNGYTNNNVAITVGWAFDLDSKNKK
jgi:outer membrane beta-barrel protein